MSVIGIFSPIDPQPCNFQVGDNKGVSAKSVAFLIQMTRTLAETWRSMAKIKNSLFMEPGSHDQIAESSHKEC